LGGAGCVKYKIIVIMELRRANLADVDELMPLIAQFYADFGYPFEATQHRKLVEHFLSEAHLGSIWLVQTAEKSIGYLALTYGFTFEFGGRDAFVDEFFIAESHRNLGLGSFAIQEIQQNMTSLGLHALHLHTESYNERAKKLYESLGFKDLKRATLTFLPENK